MLLTKPLNAQEGKLVLFHNAVTKVGRMAIVHYGAKVLQASISPVLNPF